jgi:hypothetical protein
MPNVLIPVRLNTNVTVCPVMRVMVRPVRLSICANRTHVIPKPHVIQLVPAHITANAIPVMKEKAMWEAVLRSIPVSVDHVVVMRCAPKPVREHTTAIVMRVI